MRAQQSSQGGAGMLFWGVFLGLLVAVGLAGWRAWNVVYAKYLETIGPKIEIVHLPQGIGAGTNELKLKLTDHDAGLDEILVRLKQRGPFREILRKDLRGARESIETIPLKGEKFGLSEGKATIEVMVFDRSFWSNSSTTTYTLGVDYGRPKVEAITSQHNARQGGSQFIMYRASDSNLARSGVMVGDRLFEGYAAGTIDPALDDPTLFYAVYAIDIDENITHLPVRLFAEDEVGNQVMRPFRNKVFRWRKRDVHLTLTQDFYTTKVVALAAKAEIVAKSPSNELSVFRLATETLYNQDREKIRSLFGATRRDAMWREPFTMPASGVNLGFGDEAIFVLDDKTVGQQTSYGYELRPSAGDRSVAAAQNGVVVFSEEIGTFGRAVGIDHGGGLTSIYGHLERGVVSPGQTVTKGQIIGVAGTTGLSRAQNVLFEIWAQGVPVDGREWWDHEWFRGHITKKIIESGQTLGLGVSVQ